MTLWSGIATAFAGDINGIADYELGERFGPGNAVMRQSAESGRTRYRVEPRIDEEHADSVWLRLTPDERIHRITTLSQSMDAAHCAALMTSLRKRTEKQSPSWGYYAMDQAELFYQDERTYTLECITTDTGVRLRQEFSDDGLAAPPGE